MGCLEIISFSTLVIMFIGIFVVVLTNLKKTTEVKALIVVCITGVIGITILAVISFSPKKYMGTIVFHDVMEWNVGDSTLHADKPFSVRYDILKSTLDYSDRLTKVNLVIFDKDTNTTLIKTKDMDISKLERDPNATTQVVKR